MANGTMAPHDVTVNRHCDAPDTSQKNSFQLQAIESSEDQSEAPVAARQVSSRVELPDQSASELEACAPTPRSPTR